jgi:hypothetical protein
MISERILDKEEFFYTANLKVATALATLGFRPKYPNPVTRIVRADGKESTVFWFDCLNADGMKAEKVHHWMTKGGEELEREQPEHIVNYLRAYAANRDALVDIIRATPRQIVIEAKGKRIAVREDASPEDRAEIARRI